MTRIRCYTLFDITQTGVLNRRTHQPLNEEWVRRRNTQCNFDTILQVISLRSQPEIIKVPHEIQTNLNVFGFVYHLPKLDVYPIWEFEFEVQHASVFNTESEELGLLYADCQDVPMIELTGQPPLMTSHLDVTPEFKNIHFEVV